jgi:triphosphoribosyl-dephospho-CoA synthase
LILKEVIPTLNVLPAGQLALVACLLEVSARKPGNIHRFRDFDDAHYVDFLLSASALVEPMNEARERGVGWAVLAAVEATRAVVATNTNLGMILLFAPLAAVAEQHDLRTGVHRILRDLTVDDARLVYRAIRLARPGRLGRAASQDVDSEPTVTLLEAMRLAADRDLVARQYASDFTEVFDEALPCIKASLTLGQSWETAIIAAHLNLMAKHPDTLIARKLGPREAEEAARRAAAVLADGWPELEVGREQFAALDAWLRAANHHARNPGTTADLVAAALFAALRDGTIALPKPSGPGSWSFASNP